MGKYDLRAGERTRKQLWKYKGADAPGGFMLKMSQDIPYMFGTDQAPEFLLWARLYGMCQDTHVLPLSVVTDQLFYPARTARRLIGNLEQIGLVRKCHSGKRAMLMVLGLPEARKLRELATNNDPVWRSYEQRITGQSRELHELDDEEVCDTPYPQRPNMADDAAKFGRSIYRKENIEEKGLFEPLTAGEIRTVRFDSTTGFSSDDMLMHTIFPGASDLIIPCIKDLIIRSRSTLGGSTDLLRAAKFVDLGLIPARYPKIPEQVDHELRIVIDDSKNCIECNLLELRARYSRVRGNRPTGLDDRRFNNIVESDHNLTTHAWTAALSFSDPESMIMHGATHLTVSVALFNMARPAANDHKDQYEDAILECLLSSESQRVLAASCDGWLEFMNLTPEGLNEMVDEYEAHLLNQLKAMTTLSWTPSFIACDRRDE